MYIEGDTPMLIGRAYGRVSRELLREELLKRYSSIKPSETLPIAIREY